MNTHNIYFDGKLKKIIIKYPPYLFLDVNCHDTKMSGAKKFADLY